MAFTKELKPDLFMFVLLSVSAMRSGKHGSCRPQQFYTLATNTLFNHLSRDTKLTKFHGIYQQDDRDLREERLSQGLEKAFSFMIRVRVPGGVSTSEQYLAIDSLADSHANGTIKLTTRQAYQLHGVIKKKLKPTIQGKIKSTYMPWLNMQWGAFCMRMYNKYTDHGLCDEYVHRYLPVVLRMG